MQKRRPKRNRKADATGSIERSESIQPSDAINEETIDEVTRLLKIELATTKEMLEEESGVSVGLRADFSMKEIRKLNGTFARIYTDVTASGEWAKMSGNEKAVYQTLCSRADNMTGKVNRSYEDISQEAGISKGRVKEALNKIEARKLIRSWVTTQKNNGKFQSHRHIIVLHIAYLNYRL